MNSNEFGSLEAIGIVITIVIAHLIIYLPERIINEIGPASILNIFYVTAILFVFTFIVIKLFKKFDNCDILDISYYLGGPILKRILALFFVGYCIFFTGLFLRDFAESLKIIYFHDFNISVILLLFLIASLIVNKLGFRKVVRCNFLILPAILITIIIVVGASIPDFTYQRVFPVFGYGFDRTFLFGLGTISAFSDFIILYYVIPLLKNKKSFTKVSFVSMFITAFLLVCAVSTLLLVSNYKITQSLLSVYLATRRISFGIFLRRADSLFVLIWMLSMFSYLSLTTALANYVFKKTKTDSNTNFPLFIITLLILIVSILPQNVSQLRFLENNVLKYLSIIFVFGINFIILILGNIKLKLESKRKKLVSQTS